MEEVESADFMVAIDLADAVCVQLVGDTDGVA
eukprot:CAMPEP_0185782342 /NCGR_PEP_ID=MMETSP1174-20130828/108226_1 /TAXON_ID=35687 /ORGANISM="Dictyocha speculum, Strain CCMP1381" /LENGTH=31 /DNA_ID= /DNA_START= /DNA_END= /DNA_ORIENTATION=